MSPEEHLAVLVGAGLDEATAGFVVALDGNIRDGALADATGDLSRLAGRPSHPARGRSAHPRLSPDRAATLRGAGPDSGRPGRPGQAGRRAAGQARPGGAAGRRAGARVGTGMVATAVIFSSALPAMFGTFVKHRFQNTYDAILAAPVDVEELVTAEMLWIALRSGVYGCVPLLVTFFWGLDPSWGMLLVPLFGFVTALGFAGFGITMAATVAKIDQFNYVTALFVTPLFLVAGTFFPISGLPQFFQDLAQVNPLHQLVDSSAAPPSASTPGTSPGSRSWSSSPS